MEHRKFNQLSRVNEIYHVSGMQLTILYMICSASENRNSFKSETELSIQNPKNENQNVEFGFLLLLCPGECCVCAVCAARGEKKPLQTTRRRRNHDDDDGRLFFLPHSCLLAAKKNFNLLFFYYYIIFIFCLVHHFFSCFSSFSTHTHTPQPRKERKRRELLAFSSYIQNLTYFLRHQKTSTKV